MSAVMRFLLTNRPRGGGGGVPENAILNEDGEPILNEDGEYILNE